MDIRLNKKLGSTINKVSKRRDLTSVYEACGRDEQ